MARERGNARRVDRGGGHRGGFHGRGRCRRGRGRTQETEREAPTRYRRAGLPGAYKNGSHRATKSTKSSALHLLPDDIVAQSLVPFFVWRDTSALGCVSKSWRQSMRRSKLLYTAWKTTTHTGDRPSECTASVAAQLGRSGGAHALRFVPTLALATLSFASLQDARHADGVWNELVDTIVEHDVVPVGCLFAGLLNGGLVGDDGAPIRRYGQAAVTITISIGHFARTVVDTAAFDRKALRWSASGLTEELECPFDNVGGGDPAGEKTSLLVWSTNYKSARALLSLASQWFPNVSVGGAVLARADNAPALMVFTRGARASRRSKVQPQRKLKSMGQAQLGVVLYPSSLLIRLRGNVFVKPLELCLDRPLTPILRNEALAGEEVFDHSRRDVRIYGSVSVVEFTNDTSSTHSIDTLVSHFMARGNSPGGIISLYTSASAIALRVALLPELTVHYGPQYRLQMADVRSISLYVDQRGMLTVDDHWEVGHFGIVTGRQSITDLAAVVERQMRELTARMNQDSETPLGSLLLCSTEIDDGTSPEILDILRRSLSGMDHLECFVGGEVGPIVMPGFKGNSPFQLQMGTMGGFLLCRTL